MGEDPDWRGSPSYSTFTSIRYFSLFCLLLLPTIDANHHVCGSIDIRNDARTVFNKGDATDSFIARYTNCTILEGTLSISMITNSSTKEEEFVTFPNLVEITGYLLVFNVKSLTTLSRILPNLRVIGGSQLVMQYALVIYQNPDLKDVGLVNLRVIRNGGVKIAENPSLCFVKHINWKGLCHEGQGLDDVHVLDGATAGAQCTDECDDSFGRCVKTARPNGIFDTACWNAKVCQEHCKHDRYENETTDAEGKIKVNRIIGPGCLIGGTGNESCHKECLGGCYAEDDAGQCVACKNFLHDGKCVGACPMKDGVKLYKYLSRCVTAQQCFDSPEVRVDDEWRKYKPAEDECNYSCPPNFELVKKVDRINRETGNMTETTEYCVKCPLGCPKKCKGKALDTIAMAKDLKGCNIIEGNLDIQLRDSSKMSLLTKALEDIQVIEGHLLVRFSPSLTSLAVFKNLREIKGNELFQDRYALVIYENNNLNSLFPSNVTRGLKLTAGSAQVQNNRMLCFKHVEELMKGMKQDLHTDDQSPHSNGDKAICDETHLDLAIEKRMSEGFILRWTPFNTTDIDHRKFLGYQVFYKRVDSDDVSKVSIEQDRSVCADTWSMHFEPEQSKQRAAGGNKEEEKKEQHTLNESLTLSDEKQLFYEGKTPTEEQLENTLGKNKKIEYQNGVSSAYAMAVIMNDVHIVPHAYYAAYVQTKMVNHPGARNARSNVVIVHTQFHNPTPPKITNIVARGSDSLEVVWDESTKPNGVITHYIVSWHIQSRDISFDVKHACDAVGERRSHKMIASPSSTVSPSTTSAQNEFISVMTEGVGQSDADTCSAKGCCTCAAQEGPSSSLFDEDEAAAEERRRQDDFESAVQNIVFVPSEQPEPLKREKRSLLSVEKTDKNEKSEKMEEEENDVGKTPIGMENEENEEIVEEDDGETEMGDFKMPHQPGYLLFPTVGEDAVVYTINVTAANGTRVNSFVITNLTHATTYQVSITACQDIDVYPTYCSLKPAYKSHRTAEIVGNDDVPVESIVTTVFNDTDTGKVFIRFEAPQHPNGIIHGFTVTLNNVNEEATPITHCVNSSIFAGGVIMKGLADGTYVPSIKTITATGGSGLVVGPKFTIRSPSFFTPTRIILGLIALGFLIALAGLAMSQINSRFFPKKIGMYVRQTISANPEYLSQFDVYKQDEWELERGSLTLGEEIGRGTFGKVYRGWADNIKSQCGTVFSECAIKTVSEEANPAERLHFLIEASVMKQFNSSFIIHLYGVVSDGQPVLVVMEMMGKGNLRDYLRSRRPDAEENTDHLPVPEDSEIMEWAAQIADGMAYLECLKFCHRDLAARNCMIGADNVVKIGDFGMARDIYYHEYYKPTGKRMMPVRWMAPESLKDGKFSLKSDVWSYGIVLYEMMTLAQQPYQGLANDEVFNFIGVSRRVLERPIDCPDFWYELMECCWAYVPRERPSFRQIVDCLCMRASQDFKQVLERFSKASWALNEAPPTDDDREVERTEEIIDEEVQKMFCMDNRRRNEPDDYSDRGTELINSEEEDSV